MSLPEPHLPPNAAGSPRAALTSVCFQGSSGDLEPGLRATGGPSVASAAPAFPTVITGAWPSVPLVVIVEFIVTACDGYFCVSAWPGHGA